MAVLLMMTVWTPAAFAEDTADAARPTARRRRPRPSRCSPEEGFVCETLTDPSSKSIFMGEPRYGYGRVHDEPGRAASDGLAHEDHDVYRGVGEHRRPDEYAHGGAGQRGGGARGNRSSLAEIQTGEEFSIYELLNLMMVPSGNDAALTLAKYIDGLGIAADDPPMIRTGTAG